jgi:hypothetical protein
LAETFIGNVFPAGSTTSTGTVTGILFCAKLLQGSAQVPYGTLANPLNAPDASNPDQYRSAAGTLLHEMVHAIDPTRYRDQTSPGSIGTGRNTYGVNPCMALADTNQASALLNPDNYRIFAEMSMSPGTRWSMALPPGAAPLPG